MPGLFFFVFVFFSICSKASAQQSDCRIDIEINDLSSSEYNRIVSLPFLKIKSLPLDSVKIETETDKPPSIWYGTSLKTALTELAGISLENIQKISISAPDGYSSVIYDDLLPKMENGLFAYRLKGKAIWPKKYGTCRLVFPFLRTMYWVNNPYKIIVNIGRDIPSKCVRLYFLHRSEWIETVNTDHSGRKYIPVMSLLAGPKLLNNSFRLISRDGLFREYSGTNLNNRFILKMQPDTTWNLAGINVPGGLKTRKVFSLITENDVIFLKNLNEHEEKMWINLFLPEEKTTIELSFVLKLGENKILTTDVITVDREDIYQRIKNTMLQDLQVDHAVLTW